MTGGRLDSAPAPRQLQRDTSRQLLLMTMTAMTVQEVAKYLNVDRKTVYRLVNRGEFPSFKVSGSWRFQKDDFDDWIARQEDAAANKEGDER